MPNEQFDQINANTIHAKHIVVDSGNGRHRLELAGTPDGVGLWITNGDQHNGISINSTEDRLEVGIYATNPNAQDPNGIVMDAALCASNGEAALVLKNRDGQPVILQGEDVAYLQELLDRQAHADEQAFYDQPPVAIFVNFRDDIAFKDCKAIEEELLAALTPIMKKWTGQEPDFTSLVVERPDEVVASPPASTPLVDEPEKQD